MPAAESLFDRLDSQLQQIDDELDKLGSRAADPDTCQAFAESSGPVRHCTSLVEPSQQLLYDSSESWAEEREDALECAQSLLWTAEEPEFMSLQGERAGTHRYDILQRIDMDSPRLVFRFGNAFLLVFLLLFALPFAWLRMPEWCVISQENNEGSKFCSSQCQPPWRSASTLLVV